MWSNPADWLNAILPKFSISKLGKPCMNCRKGAEIATHSRLEPVLNSSDTAGDNSNLLTAAWNNRIGSRGMVKCSFCRQELTKISVTVDSPPILAVVATRLSAARVTTKQKLNDLKDKAWSSQRSPVNLGRGGNPNQTTAFYHLTGICPHRTPLDSQCPPPGDPGLSTGPSTGACGGSKNYARRHAQRWKTFPDKFRSRCDLSRDLRGVICLHQG
jgi:hypothetical protein